MTVTLPLMFPAGMPIRHVNIKMERVWLSSICIAGRSHIRHVAVRIERSASVRTAPCSSAGSSHGRFNAARSFRIAYIHRFPSFQNHAASCCRCELKLAKAHEQKRSRKSGLRCASCTVSSIVGARVGASVLLLQHARMLRWSGELRILAQIRVAG